MAGVNFRNHLAEIAGKLSGAISEILDEVDEEGADNISHSAPYRSGELSGSVEAEAAQDEGGSVKAIIKITSPHAGYVEYGTGERGSSSNHPTPEDGGLSYGSHPGQVAQPFATPEAYKMAGKFGEKGGELESKLR